MTEPVIRLSFDSFLANLDQLIAEHEIEIAQLKHGQVPGGPLSDDGSHAEAAATGARGLQPPD